MGTFTVTLEVADPQGRRYEKVEAMVDSGAAYTVLPASLLEGLGVAPHELRTFVLADGTRVERGFGRTWIRLGGKQDVSPVVFWDENSVPLLGAVTLEIFGLGIDPVNGRLIDVDAFVLTTDASGCVGQARPNIGANIQGAAPRPRRPSGCRRSRGSAAR